MSDYRNAIIDAINLLKDEQHRLLQDTMYRAAHQAESMSRLQMLSFCIGILESKLEEIADRKRFCNR